MLVAIEKILDEKKRKNIVVAVAAEGKRSRACSETIPPQVTLELAKRATMVVASNNNNNNNGSTGGAVVAVQGDSGAMPPLSLPEGALGDEGGNGVQVQVSPDKGLAHNQRLAEKRGRRACSSCEMVTNKMNKTSRVAAAWGSRGMTSTRMQQRE